MNGKPSGHPCLALLLTLACAFTLAPGFAAHAADVNNGSVVYVNPGKTHMATNGYLNHGDLTAASTQTGGTALLVSTSGFDNHGTVNAIVSSGFGIGVNGGGFTNRISGSVEASARATDATGIAVAFKGFANYGSVTGNGENSGNAIRVVNGGFTNYRHATVIATGITAGTGIHVENDGFTNHGTVSAHGESNGIGIHVVNYGFFNYGTLTASGDSSGAGIRVENDGFENSGLLTLAGSGTSISMKNISGNDIRLLSGSTLALGGGTLDMGGGNTSLIVQPGAQVVSLLAARGAPSSTVPMFLNLRDINGEPVSVPVLEKAFNLVNGPVLSYSARGELGEYEIITDRNALASDFLSGNAGHFVGQLENGLNGKSLPELTGSLLPFTFIRAFLDSQSTVGGVQDIAESAARELTPQGTVNTALLFTGNARFVQKFFFGQTAWCNNNR